MPKVGSGGFVELVDHMGNDSAIVQAARVSYGDGTKTVQEDGDLIRYLMRHEHTTPFEMVEFKFHVRVPIHIWRQWIRHRMASVNEYSTRYSNAINEFEEIPPDQWRLQSSTNKQGSEGFADSELGTRLSKTQSRAQLDARQDYEYKLKKGIAREQARNDLPMSTYTEAYWKIDLHNLFHFLKLRLNNHAQQEIQEYAKVVAELIQPIVPIAYQAFVWYTLGRLVLTELDQQVIHKILTISPIVPATEEQFLRCVPEMWKNKKRCRERDESLKKLQHLGIVQKETSEK